MDLTSPSKLLGPWVESPVIPGGLGRFAYPQGHYYLFGGGTAIWVALVYLEAGNPEKAGWRVEARPFGGGCVPAGYQIPGAKEGTSSTLEAAKRAADRVCVEMGWVLLPSIEEKAPYYPGRLPE